MVPSRSTRDARRTASSMMLNFCYRTHSCAYGESTEIEPNADSAAAHACTTGCFGAADDHCGRR